MTHRARTYLKANRKRWKLSEGELARLVGAGDASVISRIEQSIRPPGASVLLACQVLFDIAPADLFPGYYGEIAAAVVRRAAALLVVIEGRSDRASQAKRELLAHLAQRATSNTERP